MSTTPEREITEAEVIAFITKKAEAVAAIFGKWSSVSYDVTVWGGRAPSVVCRVMAKEAHDSATESTFDEAMKEMNKHTPESKAADKRRRAAELLSEAEQLWPQSTAVAQNHDETRT